LYSSKKVLKNQKRKLHGIQEIANPREAAKRKPQEDNKIEPQ